MTTDTTTPGRQALARLVADAKRPHGVTLWCDAHRPDVEIAVGELGVSDVAHALGINDGTLYGYVRRRQIESASMVVTRLAPEASAPPADHTEASAPPPAPARKASRRRRTDTVSHPDGTTPLAEASVAYWRGLAIGLMWAIERLGPSA